METKDIAALRVLLARVKDTGCERLVDKVGAEKDHVWKAEGGYVSLLCGQLHIVPPGDHPDEWLVPVLSVAQVAGVLELAGALPPVDQTPLIRRAIADPKQFTERRPLLGARESLPSWQARAVVIALAGGGSDG